MDSLRSMLPPSLDSISGDDLYFKGRTDRQIQWEKLRPWEIRWRDRQLFFESKGYIFRPRLRPGWVPSWKTTGEHPLRTEDGHALPMRGSGHLVDATRISDGKMVYIKRVKTGDHESSIALMLSSPAMRVDSRNHSVPILDHFADEEDPTISYIVMPFLREFYFPPFELIGDVVDFVDQILDGLVFMHEQGVAHRDCNRKNIMMDASAMFPKGFHPLFPSFLPDEPFKIAPQIPRSQARVSYYFIDYGISSFFPPGQLRELVTGGDGRDQDVPELSDTVPYDPFPVDVFIIVNMFRAELLKKYSNVEFLRPVIVAAYKKNPADRPTARDLQKIWLAQRRHISALAKEFRLKGRDEFLLPGMVRDCVGSVGSVYRYVGSFFRRS